MKKASLRLVVLALTAAPPSFAQDECTSAAPVLNGAVLAFDTTTATLSAPPWSCAFNGGPDLWYSITSTTGGAITFETCGSAFDTALEAFGGTCAAPVPLACNDDACGLQSRITFTATAGSTYFVRVGGYAGATGAGTLSVTEAPAPTPMAIVDSVPGAFIDISTTGTALGLSDDGEVDIVTTVGNAVLPAGLARVGSNGGVRFTGQGPSLGYTNQPIPSISAFGGDRALLPFWDDINTSSGLNGDIYYQEIGGVLIVQWDEAAFFTSMDRVTFQLQVFSTGGTRIAQFLYQSVDSPRAASGGSATIGFQSGDIGGYDDVEWSYNTTGAVANGTVLTLVAGSGGIGVSYCSSNPNSTGSAATMSATGSSSIAANDLTLVANQLPVGSYGLFLVGRARGFAANPGGSQGDLCLSTMIARYVGPGEVQVASAAHQVSLLIDNTHVPGPNGFLAVLSGELLTFQCWYRDAVGGAPVSNFTDGLEVTFH